VLGHASLVKLMFRGWPKCNGSFPLLLVGAKSVDEDLVGALGLTMVSLLCCNGLFDVGYGSAVVTLQGKRCKDDEKLV
jgi:hypothetical protein